MTRWDIYNAKIKNDYGITLDDEDHAIYSKNVKRAGLKGSIGIIFGGSILAFIVIGMLTNQLPADQYTFIPFVIVGCITISSIGSVRKNILKAENQYLSIITAKYNLTSQNTEILANPNQNAPQNTVQVYPYQNTPQNTVQVHPYQNTPQNTVQGPPNKPKAAANCPLCNQLIPVNSNPCPKCGSKLIWD